MLHEVRHAKDYYERDAQKNRLWGTQREVALSENIFKEIKPECASLLDMGCGDGFLLHYIKSKSPKLALTGVDLSEERLARTRENVPGIKTVQGQIQQLPFEDQAFDVVVCSEVLEHLEHPLEALKELWRVARRQLIITVPNDQQPTLLDCPNCSQKFYLSGHLHRIDRKKVEEWCQNLTFSMQRIKKFHTIFTYNDVTLRWPKPLRTGFDRVVGQTERLLRFTKPNYLLLTLIK